MIMDNDMMTAFVIAIIFLIFVAVSLSLFIVYRSLSKYNDYGDSSCKMNAYSRGGINYIKRDDNVKTVEKAFLEADYGVDVYLGNHHKIPEQLKKN